MTQKQQTPRRGKRSAEEARLTLWNILDAAQQCFADYGYNTTSIKQIAEVAGITAPGVYNHFGSKADIYAAVCSRAETELINAHTKAIASSNGAKDALIKILDVNTRQFLKNPSLQNFLCKVPLEVMHNHELATPLAEKISGSLQMYIIKVIEDGQKSGEVSTRFSAGAISQTYVSALMGIAQSGVRNGSDVYCETIEVFKFLINGLLFTE